jgi:hypothetical protein
MISGKIRKEPCFPGIEKNLPGGVLHRGTAPEGSGNAIKARNDPEK